MQYLIKHRDTYYFKKRLPNTKKNLVLSLQTSNKHEANFIIAIINARLSLFLQDLTLTPNEELDLIQSTIRKYIQEAKEDYGYYADLREERYKFTTKKGDELLGSHPKALEKAIKKLTDTLYSTNKTALFNQIIEYSNMKQEFESVLAQLSPSNQTRFQDEVIKGEIELLALDRERNGQRVSIFPTSPKYLREEFAVVTQGNPSLYVAPRETQSITPVKHRYYEKTAEEIFTLFMKTKTDAGGDKVEEPKRYESPIRIFLELVDVKYLIDMTHEDLEDFIEDFLFLPDQNKNKKLFKEHNYKEIIEISKQQGMKPLAESTLANKIININAFIDFAVEREYLDKNRLRGKSNLSSKGADDKRKEYYDEQLNSLFRSRWYTTELKDNLENYPSKVWIPLILLFQGCRLNEIAQLYLDQMKIRSGIHFIMIRKTYPDQQIKNPTSRRTIPIHPTLIELGFLDFVESQKAKGYTRLFQELYHTTGKGYGQAFSKHFNDRDFKKEWLDESTMKLLEEETILLDLHSFRHNFSGSLKGLIEDGLLDHFTGHQQNSEAQRRYGKFRPKLQFEMISKSEYPDLDLSDLKARLKKLK